MATIVVTALTNVASNTANGNWSPLQPQRFSVLDATNPLFPLSVVLDPAGVIVSRPSVKPIQLPMAALLGLVANAANNMTWAPICANQPLNETVANPAATGFVSAYSAETAISYQWQQSINAGTNWSNITAAGVSSNVTTNTLNISNTNTLNSTYYRVLAYNGAGITPSNLATLLALPDPSISLQPLSQLITAPNGTTFTIAAVGNSSFTYQWKFSSNGGSSYANATGGVYSGDTTTTLTISNVTGLNGYLYKCTATDSAGNVTSNPATLSTN